MKLFLIGWNGKRLGLIETAKNLRKQGHEIIYWSCPFLDTEINRSDFPGTIFHDHYDALAGKPAEGVHSEKFIPPGIDLIRKFYDAELSALTMMNKKYENLSIDERKRLYYKILQYWYGVIQKYRPDAVIFPAAPHTVYDFVVYSLAKYFNIRTIMFETSVISDRMLSYADYKDGHPMLEEKYWKAQPAAGISDLSADLQEYFTDQYESLSAHKPIPDYKKGTYKAMRVLLDGRFSRASVLLRKMRFVLASISDLSFFKKIFYFFKKRIGPNLRKEYLSLQSAPDFGRKFVYVPLQFQPEQTTATQGGIFVDQILMIETLSFSLPENWLIYVKEHPFQWLSRGPIFFGSRPRGYYRNIAGLKNVRIVPLETNTFELLRYSKAVATVTGTAAWEAVMRSKPAFLFGHVWFQNAPGVFRVNDVDSCRGAFSKIISGYVQDKDDLIKFLRAFDKASFHGCLDIGWISSITVGIRENSDNFLNAILSQLGK